MENEDGPIEVVIVRNLASTPTSDTVRTALIKGGIGLAFSGLSFLMTTVVTRKLKKLDEAKAELAALEKKILAMPSTPPES